jgi:diguanylate cyclase (GGDEF)-like protein
MAALPWVTEYLESGRWPSRPIEFITEVVVSGTGLVMGVWILRLIRREQQYTLRHLADLEHLTLTDPLTGLANRRALGRDLPVALNRSQRLEEPLALLYMDVDKFKDLNDRFGHATGDETLRVLGAVLRSCSRSGTDVAYRVGGDEFVMTLLSDKSGAELLARRIERDFHERSPKSSRLSLGVVAWDGQTSASELLDQADSRMYQRKQTTGSRRLA